MATATGPEAATPIATLDARITAAQTKVRQIEQRIAEAVEELSSQRDNTTAPCFAWQAARTAPQMTWKRTAPG